MTPKRAHVDDEPLRPLLTVDALAAYLCVTRRTVETLISRRDIPSFKIGGSRRIDPADVDAYIQRARKAP